MIPLTRVEKEHIFSAFYDEKPNLYLVSKGKKHCFSCKHYVNENGNIKINKVFEVKHSKSFYYAYCNKIVDLRIEINNFFAALSPKASSISG